MNDITVDGIYLRNNNNKLVVKATDSYVISKKACVIIKDYILNMKKINIPIDYLIEKIVREKNMKVYWCEPTLTEQGSQIGRYTSSIGN